MQKLVEDRTAREALTAALKTRPRPRKAARGGWLTARRERASSSPSPIRWTAVPDIKTALKGLKDLAAQSRGRDLDPMPEEAAVLDAALERGRDPRIKNGGETGIVRRGYSDRLDALRDIESTVEKCGFPTSSARERDETGIRTLKVGFNKVFELLHRGVKVLRRQGALSLSAQADSGRRREVRHRRAQGDRDQDTHRGRGSGGAREQDTRRTQRDAHRKARHPPNHRARYGGAGRAAFVCDRVRGERICASRHRLQGQGAEDKGGQAPRRRDAHGARCVCAERYLARRRGQPYRRAHGSQYGGQKHLYAAGRAHRAHGAYRLFRAGGERRDHAHGPHFHEDRRERRPRRRSVNFHGRDDRGRDHTQLRHIFLPPHPRERSDGELPLYDGYTYIYSPGRCSNT